MSNRYQNQTWWVRRWRDRYLLEVPYRALRIWFANRGRVDPFSLDECWSIAHGSCDMAREYFYTWDEVKCRVERGSEKKSDGDE
jgi:hypothetical protein